MMNELREKIYDSDIYRQFVQDMNEFVSDLTDGEVETVAVDISFDEELDMEERMNVEDETKFADWTVKMSEMIENGSTKEEIDAEMKKCIKFLNKNLETL